MADESWSLDARKWKFLTRPKAYCDESRNEVRPLKTAPTRRQFETARKILKRFQQESGVLLADDVGLGKTTIGALIAWIVAGSGGCVRVLAPNDVMKRRWAEELEAHIPLLNKTAKALEVSSRQIKVNRVDRLQKGRIQVGTHHQLVKNHSSRSSSVGCDLMIIDEAHRAKGENSTFNQALNKHGHRATLKLILTATPFSIEITELSQLLGLVGGKAAGPLVRKYAEALSRLYQLKLGVDVTAESDRLATCARKAINAISPFVIRHSINDLSDAEKIHFGEISSHPLQLKVPRADEEDIELLLRAVGGGAEEAEGVVRIVEAAECRQVADGGEDVKEVFAVAIGELGADVEGVLIVGGGETFAGTSEQRVIEEGIVLQKTDEDAAENPRDADLGKEVLAPFEERGGGAFLGEGLGVLGAKIGVDGRSIGGARTQIGLKLGEETLEVFKQRDAVDHE